MFYYLHNRYKKSTFANVTTGSLKVVGVKEMMFQQYINN